MKKGSVLLKSILLNGICLVFLTCAPVHNDRLPDPKIQAGIAKLTGKVTGFHLKKGEETPILVLAVPNPVTSEMGVFKTPLGEDGSFHFEVPVECTMNIGIIGSKKFNDNPVMVGLIPGDITKIEISCNDTVNVMAKMVSSVGLTSGDLPSYYKMFINFLVDRVDEGHYSMTPEDFSHLAIEKLMVERLKRSINDSLVSGKAKNLITNQCKLKYLKGCLLTYPEYISRNFRNFKPKGASDNFTPQEPKISYYAFLKDFNLNDPQYLYNDQYTEVLQTILLNKTLNISAIKETSVSEWLKEVRTTMAGLIGSDTGLFYDLLVSNAYARQFINELKPLSDKQKENIRKYFKNEEITKILLKKNEEVVKSDEEKKQIVTIINKTPAVPKEALMKAIIPRYKGRAVVVDFWATWCGPCMDAMKEIRDVKRQMHDKDITFVYITTVSSPQKVWEEKIKLIGGDHYYLTKEEWEYTLDSFGFSGIPTYLFYDKKGVLKNKITGYPGKEKMEKMIKELL